MSDRPLLAGLRDELIRLAELVVAANARVDTVGSQLREGSGSAWLYADCLWVTNHHVVGDARGKVTLSRGAQRIFGDVVGKDADTDLAVIRAAEPVQAKPLILRQDPARLGELCFAIGAPFGGVRRLDEHGDRQRTQPSSCSSRWQVYRRRAAN